MSDAETVPGDHDDGASAGTDADNAAETTNAEETLGDIAVAAASDEPGG